MTCSGTCDISNLRHNARKDNTLTIYLNNRTVIMSENQIRVILVVTSKPLHETFAA